MNLAQGNATDLVVAAINVVRRDALIEGSAARATAAEPLAHVRTENHLFLSIH